MREIFFRGKRNGEWIEGNSLTKGKYTFVGNEDSKGNVNFEEIDPETLGIWTGLTDKNGRKIFEGDIVVVPLSGKSAKGIIKYFKTDICGFTVITQPQFSNYVLQKNCAYEIIGNIHDNPELLEVRE